MFSLTKAAIEHIHEKIKSKDEKIVIIVYQISKQACAGSYLDYYLELTSRKEIIKPELYEKYEEIDNGYGGTILVYIEKRLLSDFREAKDVLIDIEKTQKFDDEFISLILKEGKK